MTNPIEFTEFFNPNAAALKQFNIQEIQNMNTTGKMLQTKIKSARRAGKSFVRIKYCMLNINENTSAIERRDLTRSRFMANLNRNVHNNYQAKITRGEED